MNQVYIKKVKFTRVVFFTFPFDSREPHPKYKMPVEETGETYDAEVDGNGVFSYTLPESDVMMKLRDGSHRYRLYGANTKPLDVQCISAKGAIDWKTFNSWIYEMRGGKPHWIEITDDNRHYYANRDKVEPEPVDTDLKEQVAELKEQVAKLTKLISETNEEVAVAEEDEKKN